MGADVENLLHHDHVVSMAGLGNAAEVGHHCLVRRQELPARQDGRAMCRKWLNGDHGDAALGPFQVIVVMAFAGVTLDAQVGRVGAEDEAVLQRQMPDLERRK